MILVLLKYSQHTYWCFIISHSMLKHSFIWNESSVILSKLTEVSINTRKSSIIMMNSLFFILYMKKAASLCVINEHYPPEIHRDQTDIIKGGWAWIMADRWNSIRGIMLQITETTPHMITDDVCWVCPVSTSNTALLSSSGHLLPSTRLTQFYSI